MNESALEETIWNALGSQDWSDATDGAKTAVANALEEFDPLAKIHATPEFNHSFIPDLIVDWPDTTESRDVFLRLDQTEASLARDLENLWPSGPVVIGLKRFEIGRAIDPLANATEEDDAVLIMDPVGVEAIGERDDEYKVPTAVLSGGRGLLSGEKATGFINWLDELTSGSVRADATRLEAGVANLRGFFSDTAMASVLAQSRVDWELSSKDAPYPLDGVPSAGRSLAEVLLDESLASDLAYWRREWPTLLIEDLVTAARGGSPPSLGAAVVAHIDRLKVRGASVSRSTDRSFLHPAGLAWASSGRALQLRGDGFEASFSHLRDNLPVEVSDSRGVPFRDFDRRLQRLTVLSATFLDPDGVEVSLSNDDSQLDLVHDERILARSQSRVVSATVESGDAKLLVSFAASTVHGNTNAVFALQDLVNVSLQSLSDVSEQDKSLLSQMFDQNRNVVAELDAQLSLDLDSQ